MKSQIIQDHAQTLASARTRAADLARELNGAITAAAAFRDPNFTDDANAQKRRDIEKAVREQAAVNLADQRERVSGSLKLVRYAAEKARPRVVEEPASLIRSEQKWRQVQTQLQAGVALPSIIASADLPTLLAIEDWMPAQVTADVARMYPGLNAIAKSADPKAAIARLVTQRLVEVVDPDVAEDLRNASQAESSAAAAQVWHDAIEIGIQTSGGVDTLAASIGAKYAAEAHSLKSSADAAKDSEQATAGEHTSAAA